MAHTVSRLGKTSFIKEYDFLKIFDDNQSEILDKTIKDFKTILSKLAVNPCRFRAGI